VVNVENNAPQSVHFFKKWRLSVFANELFVYIYSDFPKLQAIQHFLTGHNLPWGKTAIKICLILSHNLAAGILGCCHFKT